ncbi:hypothetical protein PG991_009143 [Apiospora marii]|uniref:Cyclin N-terminal domain-containing protein n=1 Tax=Apiospora marii TaxID=335849 RepID=A0ABR1RL58_9PEZI
MKEKLSAATRRFKCTTYRIFLAALIVATKYLDDWSPRNKEWTKYSRWACGTLRFRFTLSDVNLMEAEVLSLLEWRLRITEDDFFRIQMQTESPTEQLRLNYKVEHIGV